MQLSHILVFATGALIYGALLPARWRGWTLLIVSVLALYWLQPTLIIRHLDFALPTVTLGLATAMWWLTRPPAREYDPAAERDNRLTLGLLVALVLLLSASRYLAPELRPTAARAPDVIPVALALALTAGLLWTLWRLLRGWNRLLTAAILAIVAVFVVLQTAPLATAASALLRGLTGQDVTLARPLDLEWLGFSYVAFRLIHALRERQMGKLPDLSLRQFVTYAIFFPAITAGPIDRAERYLQDDRALATAALFSAPRLTEAGGRIAVGLLKKFVLADSLALVALDSASAEAAVGAGALWLLLYAYALRLFLDFSGYTDIAIGIGLLCGVRLPENFDRPYLKQNLAAFWQSWHMTLSNWVRFYVFSPLSRALLARKTDPLLSVFAAQMVTMLIIGLWHGVTWSFVVWGLWHGAGLFVHKVWSDRTRKWYLSLNQRPRLKRAWTAAGVLITFHFVTLGWVWFALPDIGLAGRVFLGLFGIRV